MKTIATLAARTTFSSDGVLPAEVRAELVDMMFSAIVPVLMMGLAVTGYALFIISMTSSRIFPALFLLCILITAGRIALILAYRRRKAAWPARPLDVRRWERRYGLGSYGFAIALGVLNASALMQPVPVIHMLGVGLIFSYGAGLITRISVRPVICVTSLVLAVVPTLAGLATHFGDPGPHVGTAYLSVALLTGTFAIASLETLVHLYRSTLQQLVTKRHLLELAGQDALTGLPNRLLLRERFDQCVASLRRADHVIAVHALDLDRFKLINDRFGHPTGDALLQAVAGRLRNTLSVTDTLARLGGDEFVIVQTGIRHADEARMLAKRIIRVASAPYRLGEHEVHIGMSVGIALVPRDGLTLEQVTACADNALYVAKRAGRGRVVLWNAADPELPEQVSRTVSGS